MFRSLVRCARLQRFLLAQINVSILSSSVRQNSKINPSSAAKDSNSTKSKLEHERTVTKIVEILHEKLNCSKEHAQQFCTTHFKLLSKTSDLQKSVESLVADGVRTNVILNNPKMLTLSASQLSKNLNMVKDMKPIDINDFVPLVQLSTSKLLRLKQTAKQEENVVPKKHRIYYMSHAMDIEPCIVTKFISKQSFVLTGCFQSFDNKLQILLKYIKPIDLLQDLRAFEHSTAAIEERLNRARQGHKETLMPWMIRCTEKELSTLIKTASDTKEILGDKTSVEYLSDRLKYSVKTTEAIMRKYPSFWNCRVARLKEILDYLLHDAGFTPVDIAQSPRVFSCSLKTTRKRVEELKSMGSRPELSVVCRSTKEYDKFVEVLMRAREKQQNAMKE